VLPTAPALEKRAKFAALPKLGVCAKLAPGEDKRETLTKIVSTNFVFMLLGLKGTDWRALYFTDNN
jgi:hypothetical protein